MPENSSNSSTGVGNTKQPPCAVHWVFTWNNYPENFEEMLYSSKIKSYIYQQETGESGTPHLQGYMRFITKCRPFNLFDTNKIHWEKCRNVEASIKYCQKGETRTGNVYSSNDLKPIKVISEFSDWQKKCIDIIKNEPDDRSIYWFYENSGNFGKTKLAKYICTNYNAITVSGKSADVKCGIALHKKNTGLYPDIVIFDIPRCNINYLSYEALEKVKDGLFFSGKYESGMIIMNCPHVIVFANEEPAYELLSTDRWKVTKLR